MVVVFVDDDFPQPTNKIAVAATANNPRIPFFFIIPFPPIRTLINSFIDMPNRDIPDELEDKHDDHNDYRRH